MVKQRPWKGKQKVIIEGQQFTWCWIDFFLIFFIQHIHINIQIKIKYNKEKK